MSLRPSQGRLQALVCLRAGSITAEVFARIAERQQEARWRAVAAGETAPRKEL